MASSLLRICAQRTVDLDAVTIADDGCQAHRPAPYPDTLRFQIDFRAARQDSGSIERGLHWRTFVQADLHHVLFPRQRVNNLDDDLHRLPYSCCARLTKASTKVLAM